MYELLAISLSLAGLLVTYALALLLVTLFWRLVAGVAAAWNPSICAQFILLLRVTPGVAAILCVGALFLPAYLSHEPRQTTEIVTAKLGVLAALSLYAIGLALWRGILACRVTRRLVRNWMDHAELVSLDDVDIPTYRFQHAFPVIAVVGVLRPKLFIADQIFLALSDEELAAAVLHEEGHRIAGDNFKRGLLRCCRDIQNFMPLGRSLDRMWNRATELAADEHAARGGGSVALNLASALVKVARLAPRGCGPAMFAGASFIAQDLNSLSARVLRLTQLAVSPDELPATDFRLPKLAIRAGFTGLAIACIAMVYGTNCLAEIHSAMECIVSVFQ